MIFPLMTDPTPNIRFNVANSLKVMAQQVSTTDEGRKLGRASIIPAVERLRGDPTWTCSNLPAARCKRPLRSLVLHRFGS